MKTLRRTVAERLYRVHEDFIGRPTFSYLETLERSQWCSREDIESLQGKKLASLLRSAQTHSPWFAQRIAAAGLNLRESEVSLDELRALAPMDKRDARENGARIVWRDVPGGAFSYNTGGSSGSPLIFHFGRSRQASDAAGRMRARRWWGVNVGEREVYLWGAPVELNKTDIVKVVRDRLLNQLVLNAFNMSPGTMDRYLDAIRRYQPACLYGYASSVALLAAHAKDRRVDVRLPNLRVVCTTGEPLFEHQRQLIGEVFGVPVANEFGSRDIGFTAHESPEGQVLLMSESIVLEILRPDGQPAAPGELGEAVMTGLCSEAQPFIRYRTGDMIRLSAEPCRAGRGLHVIEEVVGRRTDFLVRRDGTIMHALAVIYVLRACPGVSEFKLIQHAYESVEVLVVPNARWDEEAERTIVTGLKARMGPQLEVAVQCVGEIPPEASGKHRYVVSHVPLDAALRRAAA